MDFSDLVFSADDTSTNDDVEDDPLLFDVMVSTMPEYDGKDWLHYEFSSERYWQDLDFYKVLGIGEKNPNPDNRDFGRDNPGYFICCNEKAIEAGVCPRENLGSVIYGDESKVKSHTVVTIPRNTTKEDGMYKNNPISKHRTVARFDYTTPVILLIVNCNNWNINENGYETNNIYIEGDITWTSFISKRSIPAKILLALLHSGLFLWYDRKMAENRQTTIQVEKWIRIVLAMAAIAAWVSCFYTFLEAFSSREFLGLRALSDFVTKATHVVSRCLYVVVALGLGVTKTRLSIFTIGALLALGLAVLFANETADFMGDVSFARRNNDFEDGFNQLRHDFLKLQFKLNNLFLFWIPLALLWTVRSMRNMDVQPQKLQRHKWLWRLYLFSLAVTALMVGIYLWSRYISHKGHGYPWHTLLYSTSVDRSVIDDLCLFTYWIILACMAVLWKPTPDSPLYGYVLLSGDGLDGDSLDANQGGVSSSSMEMVEHTHSPTKEQLGTNCDGNGIRINPLSDMEEIHHDLQLHEIEEVPYRVC